MSLQDKQYCFWDAKSPLDTYAMCVNSAITVVVLLISCYRLLKFRKLSQESQDRHLRICSELHILTGLWSLMFLIQNGYSIANFFIYLNEDPPSTDISSQSKIFTVLDKIPLFLVQTIFLKVCLFNYEGLFGTLEVKYFTVNHKFYKKTIPLYEKTRILIQVLGILSLIIFSEMSQMWTTSTINVCFRLIDSIIICAILIYSLQGFIQQGLNKLKAKSTVKTKLKRDYLMMIISDSMGVFINLLFLILYPFVFKNHGHYCMQAVDLHWQFFFGHNVFGIMIVHLIPILWFLHMYNYKGYDSSIQSSLRGSAVNFATAQAQHEGTTNMNSSSKSSKQTS